MMVSLSLMAQDVSIISFFSTRDARRRWDMRRAFIYASWSALGFLLFGFGFTPARADDAGCRYVKLGSLPVVFDNYRPTIVGELNGQRAVMLIDTGSFATSLTPDGATRHGLALRSLGSNATMIGVNGESGVSYAQVDSVLIGGIKGGVQQLPVIRQMRGMKQLDAIVGVNFLYQADLELNLSKPEVSFFQPVGCKQAFLGYWSKDTYYVDAEQLNQANRQLTFTVQVNGHDVLAIIDSGARTSVIDKDAAAAAGVTTDSPGVVKAGMSSGIGSQAQQAWIGPFDTIAVGPETLHKTRLLITDLTGGMHGSSDAELFGPKMLLGADFLSAHRVLFAVSQKRIYISYLGGTVFAADRMLQTPPIPGASPPAVPATPLGSGGAPVNAQMSGPASTSVSAGSTSGSPGPP